MFKIDLSSKFKIKNNNKYLNSFIILHENIFKLIFGYNFED